MSLIAQHLVCCCPAVRGVLEDHSRLFELLEVVMDLGRPPLARFPGHDERLSEESVTQADLDYATQQVGQAGCTCYCWAGVELFGSICSLLRINPKCHRAGMHT